MGAEKGGKITNYTKGRAVEYEAKKMLEKEGCLVMRTAGSHSPFDLIAIGRDTRLIQVKSTKLLKPNYKKEIEGLEEIKKRFPKIEMELWVRMPKGKWDYWTVR